MIAMKIIGHRGARGLAPENTIAGLRKAIEYNVDEIEFDVRVTQDNVVILHHDKHLSGAAGQKLAISHSTYAELKGHKQDLATLQEALAATTGTRLYIEVKQGEPVRPIIKILSGIPADRFRLGSKSQSTLRQLHLALPDVEKIIIEPLFGVRAHYRARQVGAKTICMYQLFLWWGFIRIMRVSGYKLYAYTLNNPVKARRWAKHGLAGVVTDYPDRFIK